MEMEEFRVLTVRQPMAAAIIHGGKTVENRTWGTSYRGRLFIHAGVKLETGKPDELYNLPLAFGAIIGHVRLWDVSFGPLDDSEQKWAIPGRWYWRLTDPVALEAPVPMRGLPGLQRVPAALRHRLSTM